MCDENVKEITYMGSYPSSPCVHRFATLHAVINTYHRVWRVIAVVISSLV